MITKAEALEVASEFLRELEEEVGFELAFKGDILKTQNGFAFSYDGKRMIEEVDPQFALAGNVPILVRHDGAVALSSAPDQTP